MKRPFVVVVGSANTDLVVSVAQIPTPGQTVLGGDLRVIPGGKGANQAVAAARLGGRVAFVARVGDDAYGRASLAGYQNEGIDTRFVFTTPGTPSGVALIAVESGSGQNAIVVAPGANARLSPMDVDEASPVFDAADAVVVSLEIPDDAVAAAVASGHARGVPVILNPAPARALPEAVLRQVSLCTPNEDEQRTLGGADFLLSLGITVVATLGAEGASVSVPDSPTLSFPAPAVDAVDTVAAGDCFTGALAVEIASGTELESAVRFAVAASALKVTRPGAQPGIPLRREVEDFLDTVRIRQAENPIRRA